MSIDNDNDKPEHGTIDLVELARVGRGERVEVQAVTDDTAVLFEQTLALVNEHTPAAESTLARQQFIERHEGGFVPENEHLRSIYLLAEAVGGYQTFNDLVNKDSPGNQLSRNYLEKAQRGPLSPEEVRALETYQRQILDALRSATHYLREVAVYRFTREELHELHEVILNASERSRELTRVLGTHLMHEVENAVQRLHEVQLKIRSVDHTVDGIFLVNSEVMFIPTNELIGYVRVIFDAVGNPYLARHIDGVLLLAARNLLIEVVSFFAYYGKHQIYTLFQKGGAGVPPQIITQRIRAEIRKLFAACSRDNRLVLTRVMKDAQREFELSVEAIEAESENYALAAVRQFLPPPEPEPEPEPQPTGLWSRLRDWFR